MRIDEEQALDTIDWINGVWITQNNELVWRFLRNGKTSGDYIVTAKDGNHTDGAFRLVSNKDNQLVLVVWNHQRKFDVSLFFEENRRVMIWSDNDSELKLSLRSSA